MRQLKHGFENNFKNDQNYYIFWENVTGKYEPLFSSHI